MGLKELLDHITLLFLVVVIGLGLLNTAEAMGGIEKFADATIADPTATVMYTAGYVILTPIQQFGLLYIPMPDVVDIASLFIAFGITLLVCHFKPTWNKWLVFAALIIPSYFLWKGIWLIMFLTGASRLGLGFNESLDILIGAPTLMTKLGLLFPASVGLTLYQIGSKFRGMM